MTHLTDAPNFFAQISFARGAIMLQPEAEQLNLSLHWWDSAP